MNDFQHILLTRFNVREKMDDTRLISDVEWLTQRIALFDDFCFPSVSSQTCKDFRWLVFFDISTPEVIRQAVKRYADQLPQMEIVYVEEYSKTTVSNAFRERKYCSATYIITTRLDNDDAICSDFIKRIQDEFRHQNSEVINFSHGLVWHLGKVYRYQDLSNPFASLIERTDSMQTILATWHTKLAELAPVRQVTGKPAWLQVIHGTNKRNRVRGRRTSANEIDQGFMLGNNVVPVRGLSINYFYDKFVLDHVRATREFLIVALKLLRGN